MVYRLSSSATLEAPISTSSSDPRGSRGNKLLTSRLNRPATSDEAEPTYAVRVVSDTLSTALDEPKQHLQTTRFASPLGSFWLRSALGTSRPNAARAVQNGASYKNCGRAQMAVMGASDALPADPPSCRLLYFS